MKRDLSRRASKELIQCRLLIFLANWVELSRSRDISNLKSQEINQAFLNQYLKLDEGNKMGKKQADALYERLIQQENQRLDRLANSKQRIRQTEAEICTFHPQLAANPQNRGKSSRLDKDYDSQLLFETQQRYRGMPTRRMSKSSFSSTSMFRRSEDFLMQKREKTLEKRKIALREKEMKEMENCSFNPKIHSDAYLKTKKIHVSSRENSKRYHTAQTSPVTPSKGLESKNRNNIGSGEYLELEFYEEQEKSVGRVFQPPKG